MKMQQKTFEALSTAMNLELSAIDTTMEGARSWYASRGMSMKRMRWDLFWSKGVDASFRSSIVNTYKDSHIDTALRKITQTN